MNNCSQQEIFFPHSIKRGCIVESIYKKDEWAKESVKATLLVKESYRKYTVALDQHILDYLYLTNSDQTKYTITKHWIHSQYHNYTLSKKVQKLSLAEPFQMIPICTPLG